MVIKRYLK